MFYAHFVLAKKGPLARIWLAAHWDKKLTKAHVYETNIEQSVDGIMQPKVKMALRTSGHLLLGVVRIHSRKAKYLLADCNEAFVKIKMAFRPGMVDLPEDKREAAINAITLPDVFHDFDTDIPDLDDMDIHQQFAMNQTRAEEITMREDYGNITLSTGDDGFGDSIDLAPPEMMRDSSDMGHFGDEMSLETTLLKEREISGRESLREHDLAGPSTSGSRLDAPIHDDGFGGVGLVNDYLSGGLFEEESLFEVQPQIESEHYVPAPSTIGDDDFGGAPSPMHSDGSRPGSPLEEVPDIPAPQLDATPVPATPTPSSPTHSIQSTVYASRDTTTLLHNEEESFALAPVEASALKGERRKRKRKLIVDDIKAITGEGMKGQLSDSADIVTTLDIAPPTKRLMHWKETGGVDELFNLPSRNLGPKLLLDNFKKCLKMKGSQNEEFHARDEERLNLEYIGADGDHPIQKKASKERVPKRKRHDSESAYAKRQLELARQQEEFARSRELARQPDISLPQPEEMRSELVMQQEINISLHSLGGLMTPGRLDTPAHSIGFPTPVHHQEFQQDQSGLFGATADLQPPADLTPAQQTTFTEQWVNQVAPEMMSPQYAEHDDHQDAHSDAGDDFQDAPDDEEEVEDERLEEDSEMQEDETIEQFEDRILNKRAAQMHRNLEKRFAGEEEIDLKSMLNRNLRKQVAQKFYSVLVLQKVMAVRASQGSDSYGQITITQGPKFASAIKLL